MENQDLMRVGTIWGIGGKLFYRKLWVELRKAKISDFRGNGTTYNNENEAHYQGSQHWQSMGDTYH